MKTTVTKGRKSATSLFLAVFTLNLLCLLNAHAWNLRWYNGRPGNPVNFEIDGNYFTDAAPATSQDWSGALTRAVLLQSGGVSVPGLNIIDADQVSNWAVDQNWGCSGCNDRSQFDGSSNKNNDDISLLTNNWTYSSNGQGPQKNDLTNVMMFLKRSAGETWLIGGVETRCSNGDSHIDFEYNQAGVFTSGSTTSGYIKGNGPVKGRTLGDFVVSIDYENGGSNPMFTLRVWNLPGQYDTVNVVPGTDYFFAANTSNISSVAPNRGVSTSGNPTSSTSALQFVEFAVKSTVINALFNSPSACNTNATLNIKTRSSQSFTAELKDFYIMPVVITLPPDVTCGPDQCACQLPSGNTFNLRDSICNAGYTYSWTKVSSTGTLSLNIVSPAACSTAVNTTGYGTAVIKMKATKGACSDSCTTQIIVRPNPVCSITVPGGSVCPNTSTTHSAPAGYDKYAWTVTGNASIQGASNGQSVSIIAGAVCGSYTVSLEAGNNGCTSGSYCTSTCSETVQVQDGVAPSISTLTNKSIACTATVVFDTPTASDNCDPNPSLTSSDQTVSGNAVCRVLRRTWTATDICGNTSTRTQDITVTDNVAPTISSLSNKSIACTATVVFDTPTASDNCDPSPSLTSADQTISGNAVCRVLRRTWTATDLCGNTSTRTQDITVTDNVAPVITSLSNKSISCTDPVVFDTPTASDNCDPNPSLTSADSTIGTNPVCRTLRRTWTSTDLCGNTATRIQDITVTDNVNPVLTVGSNQTINCTATPVWGTPSASDNCDPSVSITYNGETRTNGTCTQNYTLTRSWTATDICGNQTTQTQAITFQDNTPPSINCGADKTLTCNQSVSFDTPVISDDCGTATLNVVRTDTTNNTDGSITYGRTFNASDNCGNTSGNCIQRITVPACTRFCTYTQGAYGNAGGVHCNGQTTPAFVAGLLSTPLVVGAGTRTVTFASTDVNCLISKLPAGGTANSLGGTYTCANVQPIYNGKIYNILLGQTITLGLNLRINGTTLSNVVLSGRYLRTAQGSGTGCSSLGTATGGGQTWALPQSVITYLGTNNRISDLYNLANRALGRTYIPSGTNPTLSDINNAVDIINNAFDGCRILVSISGTAPRRSFDGQEQTVIEPASSNLLIYPNPFQQALRIRTEVVEQQQLSIELYSMDGRKVQEVFNGSSGDGGLLEFEANTSALAPGTYLCKVVIGSDVRIERVVLMK